MATATERRWTPDDLLTITDRPTPELVDGQLVEREPIGQEADAIAMRIVFLLGMYCHQHRPGTINGPECGYRIFPDHPDKVRYPDVSFTRRDRLPDGKAARGHATIPPDLAVEVVSPNDNAGDLIVKLGHFLDAGVAMVWVVNPDSRSVEVIRADRTAAFLRDSDTLDGGDVLPGFRCRVAEIFE